jgi:hypothetical protein
MRKRTLVHVATAVALFGAACTRSGLTSPADSGVHIDTALDSSGSGGVSGATGSGGAWSIKIQLPDGGLSAIFGDGGLWAEILDASRDNLLGQVLCDSKVKSGDTCSSTTTIGCLLPSLGGACACLNGTYLCPANTSQSPQPCPAGAATGTTCLSLLSTCIGGSANACICGLGTYTCL